MYYHIFTVLFQPFSPSNHSYSMEIRISESGSDYESDIDDFDIYNSALREASVSLKAGYYVKSIIYEATIFDSESK